MTEPIIKITKLLTDMKMEIQTVGFHFLYLN